MWDNLTVNGFRFDDAKEYAQAKREAEAIEYITMKMDVQDPKAAVQIYYKLLERKTMHTIVGMTFLWELRARIIASGAVSEESLNCIDVISGKHDGALESYGDAQALSDIDEAQQLEPPSTEDPAIVREKRLRNLADYYKQRFKKVCIVAVALVFVIIGMFVITLCSDQSPFADAEAVIQDKYSAWAEELDAKEQELRAWENELESQNSQQSE